MYQKNVLNERVLCSHSFINRRADKKHSDILFKEYYALLLFEYKQKKYHSKAEAHIPRTHSYGLLPPIIYNKYLIFILKQSAHARCLIGTVYIYIRIDCIQLS